MRADNHGEGGIMALLALVARRSCALRAAGRVGGSRCLVVVRGVLLGDGIITRRSRCSAPSRDLASPRTIGSDDVPVDRV